MIRTFIALEVDDAVRDALAATQARLMQQFRAAGLQGVVRPVGVKQMHLTLCFLGDIEESSAAPLIASLQQMGETWRNDHGVLALDLERLGAFPNLKRPRVIWCGIGGETAGLMALQEAVVQTVAPWHEEADDKAFHPHLTLFRIKTYDQSQSRRLGEIVRDTVMKEKPVWHATEVRVIKSELLPAGPVYTTLATVSLS